MNARIGVGYCDRTPRDRFLVPPRTKGAGLTIVWGLVVGGWLLANPESQIPNPDLHNSVRVLLFSSTTSVRFSGERLEAVDAGEKSRKLPESVEIALTPGGFRAGRHGFQSPLRLSASGPIHIEKSPYRGEILLHENAGRLLVINELSLEEYLVGVVPKEVPEEFPQEALKAQAVVSRTFLLKNIGKYPNKPYQITNTILDQVYGGMLAERPQTTLAVSATRGEVLMNGSGLINSVMHDNCGGHTENAAHVWPQDVKASPKYLQGVACHYCKGAPWYRWSSRFSGEEIEKALAGLGVEIRLKSILPSKRCQTERARRVLATPKNGRTRSFSSQRFRMALGPHRLRSTRFTVNRASNGDFIFKGRGWGHGVGFCQWGARGQALKKRGYARILKFYFPGTRLARLSEEAVSTRQAGIIQNRQPSVGGTASTLSRTPGTASLPNRAE